MNNEKMNYRVMLLPAVVCRVAIRVQHWSHHQGVIGSAQITYSWWYCLSI